jgi:hypothetical protein
MRRSLWVAYPTGVYNRPADFQLRFTGIGCVAQYTVAATSAGVTFLSDEGVVNFNVNEARVISDQINSDLLPLDYTRVNEYAAVYIPAQHRYILTTPTGTWIYEFERPGRKARWFFRSLKPESIAAFADQYGVFSWEDLVGTWDDQNKTWGGLVPNQGDEPPKFYASKGSLIAREDYASTTYFETTAQNPIWRTPFSAKVDLTKQFTTKALEISYRALAPAMLKLYFPDHRQDFNRCIDINIPATGTKLAKARIDLSSTGMGVALEIRIIEGQPEIGRIKQTVVEAGQTRTMTL